MKHGSVKARKLLAMICAILILAYAFAALLSLSHKCSDAACEICLLFARSRAALLLITSIFAVFGLLNLSKTALYSDKRIPCCRENTPVGLKVKLSD